MTTQPLPSRHNDVAQGVHGSAPATAQPTTETGALASAWSARDTLSKVAGRSTWVVTTLATVAAHHFVFAGAKGGDGEGAGESSGAGGKPSGSSGGSASGTPSRPSPSGASGSPSKGNPTAFGQPITTGGQGIVRGIPVAPYRPGIPYESGTAYLPPTRGISAARGSLARPLPAGLLGLNAGLLLDEDIELQPVGYFSDPWLFSNFYDPDAGESSDAPNCTMGAVNANDVLVGGTPTFLDDDEFEMIVANLTEGEATSLTHVRNEMLEGRLDLSELPADYLNVTALRAYCMAPPSSGLSGGAIAGIAVGTTAGTVGLIGLLAYFCCRRRPRRRSS